MLNPFPGTRREGTVRDEWFACELEVSQPWFGQ